MAPLRSSHNTYLLSRQLLGKSSASAYTNVILRGCTCVEIDLWHSSKGLRVTHGYTLSSSVGFEDVCNAIAEAARVQDRRYKNEGGFWPILISLENHVPVEHQEEVIDIMKRTMGQWLVLGKLDHIDDLNVTPRDFRGRIVVMVGALLYPASTKH
jgi:phosphatidylinositol phospholipase C, delta